jgi:hypothetical protein
MASNRSANVSHELGHDAGVDGYSSTGVGG